MPQIHYRWMNPEEVVRIADIDRAEEIRIGYRQTGDELEQLDVQWDSPPWGREGQGEHSVSGQIQVCRDHLERGGRMFGAFDAATLVGIGLLQPGVEEGVAQLAFLHVSNQYRQKGIGRQITAELIREAKKMGASQLYVSATPSGSAVNFYRSQGFKPTATPIPALFDLEPEDIHMRMDL